MLGAWRRFLDFPSSLPALFLLFACPACLLLALDVPPGQVPDEGAHIARAASLLYGELVGRGRPTGRPDLPVKSSGVVVDPAFVFATMALRDDGPKKLSQETWDRLRALPWTSRPDYIHSPNTAVYFPVFYVPMAAGLGLARVLGVTPVVAVLVARVAALFAYLVAGAMALRLARRGQVLLFAILCLPMTWWLAASVNQDGVIVAFTCLAAALLTRAPGPRGAAYWWAGAILACFIAVKPPYAPVAAAMLLPCTALDRAQLRRAAGGVALAVLPGLLWASFAASVAFAPFVRGEPYHPGPLWPGDPTQIFVATDPVEQLRVFLHRPWLAITLPLRAMWSFGDAALHSMVGTLGLLDVPIAGALTRCWFAALGCAALAGFVTSGRDRACDPAGPRPVAACTCLLALLATVFVIYDQQYLLWDFVGNAAITGVQGRYALPLLAIAAISLPQARLRAGAGLRGALAFPSVALAGFGLIYLPQLVIDSYYLR